MQANWMRFNALFESASLEVSFSYYFIFDRIMCVLVTLWERGHFVMLIVRSMHLINLHFWIYLPQQHENSGKLSTLRTAMH